MQPKVCGGKVNELGICGTLNEVVSGYLVERFTFAVLPAVGDGGADPALDAAGGSIETPGDLRVELFGDVACGLWVPDGFGDGVGEVLQAAELAADVQGAEETLDCLLQFAVFLGEGQGIGNAHDCHPFSISTGSCSGGE